VLATDFSGRDHPLVAVWARSCAEPVAAAVRTGRLKVRGLLADLRVRRLGPTELRDYDLERVLCNVNDAEDLERLAAWGV
jgi:molybdopterin-guanine dinucleotide biosynthesis protein A